MKNVFCFSVIIALCLWSCINKHERQISGIVNKWNGKIIDFPINWELRNYAEDSSLVYEIVNVKNYAVFSYTDSTDCVSCKLNFQAWSELISTLDSLSVPCLFVLNPKIEEQEQLKSYLKRIRFSYPVYIDVKDSFNILNNFPKQMEYQTFLLDWRDKRVVAVGNPIYIPEIKELYLRIIQGKTLGDDADAETPQTTVSVSSTEVSLGGFPWQEPQSATLTLTNTGTRPLVVQDVVTSCGCLTVDYLREPVRPGGEAALRLTYKADNPGYFRKTVTVYANAEEAPLRVQVSGNAE